MKSTYFSIFLKSRPQMIFHNVIRNFSAASAAPIAARQSNPLMVTVEEKLSRLPNGLTVASVDLQGAVSQFVLAFRAGARYQQYDEAGLVHHIRNCIGTDSANYLGLKMLWQSGNIGSNLTPVATKDLFMVQLSVVRTYASVALSLLGELSQPAFKPWNTNDTLSSVDHDVSSMTTFDILIENLHKAAYREGGMGNSIISPSYNVGKISHQVMANYGKSRLVSSNAVLMGINVDHSVILNYAANQGSIAEGKAKNGEAARYFGGEKRQEDDSHTAHVAIAGEGAKLTDKKSLAVHSVLTQFIGKGSQLKFPNAPGFGVVSNHVLKAANHNHVDVNALNIVHSDTGLSGLHLVADGNKIGSYVKAAVESLRELSSGKGINNEAISIAKKLAQVDETVKMETTFKLAKNTAEQILANGSPLSPIELAKEIENVTAEDIKKAAAKVVSKLSISAHGQIHQVPYLDEL